MDPRERVEVGRSSPELSLMGVAEFWLDSTFFSTIRDSCGAESVAQPEEAADCTDCWVDTGDEGQSPIQAAMWVYQEELNPGGPYATHGASFGNPVVKVKETQH